LARWSSWVSKESASFSDDGCRSDDLEPSRARWNRWLVVICRDYPSALRRGSCS
jgi:hypothetical protein